MNTIGPFIPTPGATAIPFAVYWNGGLTNAYLPLKSDGILTFTSIPPAGTQITVDMTYFWRVRFEADSLDFTEFAANFWELRKIVLIGVNA
ncbi:MAG: hypothetical protein NVS1B6_00550 [Steroidobacteraceae bacterium]